MRKLLLLLLIPFAVLANPIDDQCPQHVLRGAPVSPQAPGTTQYLCKQNYAIHYRYDTKTAEYVVQHVTLQSISGPAKRKDDFRADPTIPPEHRSVLSDYAGFPFDRGHLSPGAAFLHTCGRLLWIATAVNRSLSCCQMLRCPYRTCLSTLQQLIVLKKPQALTLCPS